VWALKSLGWVAAEEGAYDEATRFLREGFEIAMPVGNRESLPELLGAVVEVAVGRGRAADAAVLAGASDALHYALGGTNVPAHDSWFRLLDRVRGAVGASEFESLYIRGRALELEDAVSFALTCLD
jgi:hypothetical protein